MEIHFTITRMKSLRFFIAKLLVKWISNYINAMSQALYPPETRNVQSKNDRHRTFYK